MNSKKIMLCASVSAAMLFALPVHAEESSVPAASYVTDNENLLTMDELNDLEEYAQEVSEAYECGVYIRVETTYAGYSTISDYAEYIYNHENMGYGEERNGILFIITMDEREYDFCAYGDTANYAFTDYAKECMAESMIDDLSDGDYADAFDDYINSAEYDLHMAASGQPVDEWIPNDPEPYVEPTGLEKVASGAPIIIGVPCILSLIICMIQKSKNKTAKIATTARNYIPENGIRLTGSHDFMVNRTVTRTPIVHSQPSGDRSGGGHMGGTSVNSGGFSHHSGKF